VQVRWTAEKRDLEYGVRREVPRPILRAVYSREHFFSSKEYASARVGLGN